MGFLSRALVPRGVRRAAHPVRTVKSAATPRVVKQARSALNPIDTAAYSVERALNTKPPEQQVDMEPLGKAVLIVVCALLAILAVVISPWIFWIGLIVLCVVAIPIAVVKGWV
jgi:Flp pilus assembly protein TadB